MIQSSNFSKYKYAICRLQMVWGLRCGHGILGLVLSVSSKDIWVQQVPAAPHHLGDSVEVIQFP